MTRFKIYGEYLETDKLKFTLKKVNSLFCFDDLECERTTSFAIPATPTNNRLLRLSNDVATFGERMRVKIDATMEDGIISREGYIYITDYNSKSKEYNAIFVCGIFKGLLASKDAGTFDTFGRYIFDDVVEYNRQPVHFDADWCCKEYRQKIIGMERLYPSVRAAYLVERAAAEAFGLNVILPQDEAIQFMRLVPDKLMDSLGNEIEYDGSDTQEAALAYNLPSVTFPELLKVVSYVSATAINIDNDIIVFEDLQDVDSWQKIDLTNKFISVDKMSRKFRDTQNMFIKTKTESDSLYAGIGTYDWDNPDFGDKSLYHTDNYNLEQNEIVEIPFDGGGALWDDWIGTVIFEEKMEAFGIGKSAHNNPNLYTLTRPGGTETDFGVLPVNPFLQSLFFESTLVEVKVRMTLFEYETMQQKSIIYALGQQFVWREIQWSEGFATIKLQKFY